jgi:hypothetical protein
LAALEGSPQVTASIVGPLEAEASSLNGSAA